MVGPADDLFMRSADATLCDLTDRLESVEAVLFDLDDTLVEYELTSEELFDRIYDEMGIEPAFPASEYYTRYDQFLDESTDTADHRRRCFVAAAEANGYDPELGREIARRYTRLREETGVRFRPGAVATLETVTADFAVGLVTNGSPTDQQPKIDAVSLDDWIDTTVFAGYDTAAKPDPEPFYRALSALKVSPERAIAIGDSLSSDVAGAAAADITSVWVPSYDQSIEDVSPDYTLESLVELAEAL